MAYPPRGEPDLGACPVSVLKCRGTRTVDVRTYRALALLVKVDRRDHCARKHEREAQRDLGGAAHGSGYQPQSTAGSAARIGL